jgi:sialic acid synthase SpsE
MGDIDEIRDAIEALRSGGSSDVILLHCVSSYPAPPEDANLRALSTLRETFAMPVGFSDHTVGTMVTLAAVALGACVVEKHFTLDRSLAGPDHAASIEPDDLARLVSDIRAVESALGDGRKTARSSERDAIANLRKSIVARRDMRTGTVLREEDLALKRPGGGLPAKEIPALVGRQLSRDVRADEMIRWGDVG